MTTKELIKRARELAALRNYVTAGPWYVLPGPTIVGAHDGRSKHHHGRIHIANVQQGSARGNPLLDGGSDPFGDRSNPDFDAQLIAAAPEMAALLEQLADRLESAERADAQINEALNS